MANKDVCQGCVLSETNHRRCVNSERRRKAVTSTTCVVAVGVGKEGSRQPSLLERNHYIKLTSKLATKQQNVRILNNQKLRNGVFKAKIHPINR